MRRVDRHGLQRSVGSDPLIRPDDLSGARLAVDRRPDHEHLVDGRDVEVGVVGGPQTHCGRGLHRAQVIGLFLATVEHVRVGEKEGVHREERRDELVVDVFLELILAHELRMDIVV